MAAPSPTQQDLINFIEQYWYLNHKYPSSEAMQGYANEIDRDLSVVRRIEIEIEPFLASRGIRKRSVNSRTKKFDKRLSTEQMAAVAVMVDMEDKRNFESKLKSLGIKSTTWTGWLRDETFCGYMTTVIEDSLQVNLYQAHTSLMKKVAIGDTQALKLYYEMTGRYRKEESPVGNANYLVTQLIEVIQRQVSDPRILQAIAADFELVMQRNQLVPGVPPPFTGYDREMIELEGELKSVRHLMPEEITKNDRNEIERDILTTRALTRKLDEEDLFSM